MMLHTWEPWAWFALAFVVAFGIGRAQSMAHAREARQLQEDLDALEAQARRELAASLDRELRGIEREHERRILRVYRWAQSARARRGAR